VPRSTFLSIADEEGGGGSGHSDTESIHEGAYNSTVERRRKIISAVEAVLDEVDGLPYADSRLRKLLTDENRAELESLLIALGYHFIAHDEKEARARSEDAFGAAIEFDNRRFPPTIKSLPPETLGQWEAMTADATHPALTARLHDLLWVARNGTRPDLHARSASDAYLLLGDDSGWHPLERADALARSLELARAVGDDERRTLAETSVLKLLAACHSTDSESDLGSPGVVMSLLRALNELGRLPAAELDQHLAAAEDRFPDTPHVQDSITDLRELVVDDGRRRELRKGQIERWRTEARGSSGITRTFHLEHALELARLHHMVDEERELLLELQEVVPGELELKEISAQVEIPTERMQEFVESLLDPENRWQGSMVRFGNFGPPGGSDEDVADRVSSQMKETPIQFLVTKVVYGPAGTSIFKAADDASHRHLAVAEHRAFAARIWAITAVQVLAEISDRSGKPEEAELAQFFTTDLIPADLAVKIARCLDLYWDGRYDEAAHMLAPRLERVIRELARTAGIPIIAPPQGLRPGRVRSLGDLLRALKGAFAEDAWRAYLMNVLADPLGLNLRNIVGHALQPEMGQGEAALLIHAACYLRLLGARRSEAGDGGE
jgi:hypothetical protein